jgi:hypothetical protein
MLARHGPGHGVEERGGHALMPALAQISLWAQEHLLPDDS